MAIVYQHRRLDTNEIFYIGVGINVKRSYSKVGRNNHWLNIVNSVGYKIDILFTKLSWDDARRKEIELIKQYGRRDKGLGSLVNMTDGGDGQLGNKSNLGKVFTKEHKDKISKSHIGIRPSEESKNKNRLSHIGNKHTDESKFKISEESRNRIRSSRSEETKRKISETLKNKKLCQTN